jgi:hypothetical protein
MSERGNWGIARLGKTAGITRRSALALIVSRNAAVIGRRVYPRAVSGRFVFQPLRAKASIPQTGLVVVDRDLTGLAESMEVQDDPLPASPK